MSKHTISVMKEWFFCIWFLLYMYYSKRFWLENERRQRIDTLISFRKCKYSLSLKLKQHLKVVSKHELVSAPNLFNRRQIDISIKSAFADDTFNINLAQSNAILSRIHQPSMKIVSKNQLKCQRFSALHAKLEVRLLTSLFQ